VFLDLEIGQFCVEGSPARLPSDLINKLEADSRAARPHRQLAKPAI
jgi:hypothetical protein